MTATLPNLPSQYEAKTTETKWQKFWEENEVFKADPKHKGDRYAVVTPPPNVTGSLHMGHAFNTALIDTVVRYQRMLGKNTLCLPGTDHASIAVQTIIEKQLKAEGKTRSDLGRKAFLDRTWEWKKESGGIITGQLRRLGLSADWSRERFTLDDNVSKSVLEAFVRLHKEGLIYRGNYLVNWCPASQSAVSDLEVDNREIDGNLWHFRYPLTIGNGFIEVATTRPETMLGDTAVAVNPTDDRYKSLVGKTVLLPLVNREIPIIADDYVDATFGTGCVKITPAHDTNDFEMGKRQNLPFINVMNKDGTMNENAGEFEGIDRFEARKQVVAALDKLGFLVKIEPYKTIIPYSERGGVPVEPLLSTQWFVNTKPMATKALAELDENNSPEYVPDRWKKVYRDWLVNLRDWCISRQLWWGHQIPAWYAVEETGGLITDSTPFFVAKDEAEAAKLAQAKYGKAVKLEQDPDVLDTWFSSGLWPFSTLGWPEATEDFAAYYPTSTLVTGFDIIFFWVARMTMMAGHLTGEMPFKNVYIHGLVRDETGAKMSKSKNNGVDPLVLIDEYSTDALRYTLIREVAGAGQDISLQLNRKLYNQRLKDRAAGTEPKPPAPGSKDNSLSESVEASRNFTNKLWNASRFVLMNLEGKTPEQLGAPETAKLELCDRWILSRYHQVTQALRDNLDNFSLGEGAKQLYEFIWGDFCDLYIELVKYRLQGEDTASKLVAQQTLALVLEGTLKLLHPFMPHITEEIWHTVVQKEATGQISLALEKYPESNPGLINADLESQFELLIGTIRTIRNLRSEAGIKPGEKIEALLQSENDRERTILTAGQIYIQNLARVKTLSITNPKATAVDTKAIKPATPPKPDLTDGDAIVGEAFPLENRTAWADRTWLEKLDIRDLADDLLDYLSNYQKLAITIWGLTLTIVAFNILKTAFDSLHQVSFVSSFLEDVGFFFTIFFVKDNLLKSDDRQRTFSKLKKLKGDLFGDSPTIETIALATPTQPETVAKTPATDDLRSVEDHRQTDGQTDQQTFAGVVGTVQVLIPLDGLVDIAALKAKLEKDLARAQNEAQSVRGRLSNQKFVAQAPEEVVQGAKNALAEAEKQAELIQARLSML
jgi:valyl-tRNA synthetase